MQCAVTHLVLRPAMCVGTQSIRHCRLCSSKCRQKSVTTQRPYIKVIIMELGVTQTNFSVVLMTINIPIICSRAYGILPGDSSQGRKPSP